MYVSKVVECHTRVNDKSVSDGSQSMRRIFRMCQVIAVVVSLRLLKYGLWSRLDSDTGNTTLDKSEDLPGASMVLNQIEAATIPPWHVAIITKPSNTGVLWCGGSLISKKFVLTAAHCLERSQDATVILDKKAVKTNKFRIHPKWQPRLLLNDVALIELPRTPDLPDPSPVHLSTDAKIAAKPAVVYGWENGSSQPMPSEYEARIISNKDCAKYYGALITKYTICAERNDPGNGCHGFSGGGMVVDEALVGVVSFGTDQCNMGYPTVFTRVSRYKKWITNNTAT